MKKNLPNSFLRSLFAARAVMVFCFLAFVSPHAFAQTTVATVQTDQMDYPPGATVYITGSGFTANEAVTLQVLHYGPTDDNLTSPAHQPWTVAADSLGNISSTWVVPTDDDELGATLQLTAVGQTSGLTASEIFTDNTPPALVYPTTNTFFVGTSVNLVPTNSGGGNPTSCSINPTTLPAGLTFDTHNGTISGTPTAVTTTASYVVTATNSGGSDVTSSFSITVKIPPPAITYPSPNTIITGTAITTLKPTSSGGAVASYSAPVLPAGLSIDPTTGFITGTPTTVTAQATYTVTATNTTGTGTFGIVITVNPPAPIITYTSPDVYITNVAISALNPNSTGGAVASYSVNPTLPAGLTLNTSTGVITGTPTTITAQATYTVTATNVTGTGTFGIVITVNPPAPNISYTSPDAYVVGTAITALSPTTNGIPVASYSVSPALPAGLTLNTSTGVITGTPTTVMAQATYTVTATNVTGTGTFPIVITVNPAKPIISYTTPDVYITNIAISTLNPNSTGGAVASYSVNPALPAGLTLDASTGVITGTPTTITAQATYTVTATNVTSTGTFGIVITVNPPAPIISYNTPNTFVYGTPITALNPSNTGGAAASYSVNPALPAGLSLNTSTGVITGTPTSPTASANYTVTATNVTGNGTFVISITVNKRTLNVTATAANKVYDGTTAATVTLSDDRLSGDRLNVNYASATFSDKNVGIGKTVTISGIFINGQDAGDYTLASTSTTTTANISQASLTVTATGIDKTYDATTTATVNLGDNKIGGDNVTDAYTSASFADKNVGQNKPVSVSGISISGTDAGNYSLANTTASTTANISQASLTVTANSQTKCYGTALSETTGSTAFTSSPLIGTETIGSVTIDYGSGAAATDPAGTYTNTISPSGATGGSFNPNNYSISYVPGTLTVTPAVLTITANPVSAYYGYFDPSTLTVSYSGWKNGEGDINGPSVLGVLTTLPTATTLATNSSSPGTYTITAGGAAANNYTFNYVSGILTINAVPILWPAIAAQVYGTSDFDPGASSFNNLAAVTYTSSNPLIATIVSGKIHIVGAGTSIITANNGSSMPTQTLTVTPYPTCISYNGTTFVNTDVSSTTTATNNPNGNLVLSIAVSTPYSSTTGPASAVHFTYNGSTVPATTVSYTTNNGGELVYSYPIPSLTISPAGQPSMTIPVTWTITGNYSSNTSCSETTTDLTISTRSSDFVTGGGFVKTTASSGKYAGTSGTKANFGFNVKWNKNLTNIQGGGFNAIVRGKDPNTGANVLYQIKGTKVLTLMVNTQKVPYTSTFTSNATLQEYNVTGTTLLYSQGNCSLTVTLTDACEPGPGVSASSDLIGITLKDNYGNLLYSNNWVSNNTVQQMLGGGNLQIHGDSNTPAPTCSSNTTSTTLETAAVVNGIPLKDRANPLIVTVYPNPSISTFSLQSAGGTAEKLEIRVSDIFGHLIEQYTLMPGATMTIGDKMQRPGVYIVQVKQGQTYKVYKVYKQQ
jgi:hypothetical protein